MDNQYLGRNSEGEIVLVNESVISHESLDAELAAIELEMTHLVQKRQELLNRKEEFTALVPTDTVTEAPAAVVDAGGTSEMQSVELTIN